jgi:hypothetical protein
MTCLSKGSAYHLEAASVRPNVQVSLLSALRADNTQVRAGRYFLAL